MSDEPEYVVRPETRRALEDPTVEICELPPPSALALHLARLAAHDALAREHRRFKTRVSLTATCAVVLGLAWFAGSGTVDPGMNAQDANAGVAGAGPSTAVVLPGAGLVAAASLGTRTQEPAQQVARTDGLGSSGSAARRECMTQVESAVLFHRLAKDSASQGAYNVAVNREIKRLLARNPLRAGPVLDLIGVRSWQERSQPSASSAWWTTQYQRCEQSRSQGVKYLVHL